MNWPTGGGHVELWHRIRSNKTEEKFIILLSFLFKVYLIEERQEKLDVSCSWWWIRHSINAHLYYSVLALIVSGSSWMFNNLVRSLNEPGSFLNTVVATPHVSVSSLMITDLHNNVLYQSWFCLCLMKLSWMTRRVLIKDVRIIPLMESLCEPFKTPAAATVHCLPGARVSALVFDNNESQVVITVSWCQTLYHELAVLERNAGLGWLRVCGGEWRKLTFTWSPGHECALCHLYHVCSG